MLNGWPRAGRTYAAYRWSFAAMKRLDDCAWKAGWPQKVNDQNTQGGEETFRCVFYVWQLTSRVLETPNPSKSCRNNDASILSFFFFVCLFFFMTMTTPCRFITPTFGWAYCWYYSTCYKESFTVAIIIYTNRWCDVWCTPSLNLIFFLLTSRTSVSITPVFVDFGFNFAL